MRKPVLTAVSVLLVASLALPGVALAKGGNSQGPSKASAAQAQRGKGHAAAASQALKSSGGDVSADTSTAKQTRKAAKAAAKESRKAEKAAAKQTRKAEKAAAKPTEPVAAEEDLDGQEPPVSENATGIANAISRITINLQRSLDRIAAGKKGHVPPGLVAVWVKFATLLGIDQTTRPGYEAPELPTGVQEPSGTDEPTDTVDPTGTVEPTGTVDPPEPPAL